MPRPDDDALSWEGDDDPTLDTGADAAAAPAADGARSADRGADPEVAVPTAADDGPTGAPNGSADEPAARHGTTEGDPADAPDAPERRALGDVALVTLGVLAGVYLLWTLGWVLGTVRLREWIQVQTGAVADAMFHGAMVLGILAPAIWFGGTWFLTRGRPAWVRIAALVLGVVVLVPWPFVMMGVIGR